MRQITARVAVFSTEAPHDLKPNLPESVDIIYRKHGMRPRHGFAAGRDGFTPRGLPPTGTRKRSMWTLWFKRDMAQGD